MNGYDSQRQLAGGGFKRRWPDRRHGGVIDATASFPPPVPSSGVFLKAMSLQSAGFGIEASGGEDEDLVAAVIPPVTVVLEGRSICHRISLHKHGGYRSLAKALREMFVEEDGGEMSLEREDDEVELSNAVPGHLIAYEDFENDLLLAGDLNWNDFVRVAKRIRILPIKANARRGRGSV